MKWNHFDVLFRISCSPIKQDECVLIEITVIPSIGIGTRGGGGVFVCCRRVVLLWRFAMSAKINKNNIDKMLLFLTIAFIHLDWTEQKLFP